jgi:ABC-2 type transport system permease protein
VLIFGEPVNGLDPGGIHWVRTLMRALAAEGRAVLVSGHLMSEMALTAGHLLVIGKGALIADASAGEFVRSSSRQPVHVRSPRAAELAAARGIALSELIPVRASLEEAFTELTRSSVSARLSWDPTGVSQPGAAIASLAIVVLGVLCVSSGYSSGMIRTSLIAVPKRGRVLAARSLVFAAVTFVAGEVTCFAAFFAGQALTAGHAPRAALGDPGAARAVAGGGLYLAALAVLSVAAGTLPRHPAAATAAMIAVLLVLPAIARALPHSWRNPVTGFWPAQAGPQLTDVCHSARTLQPWPGFGAMCWFTAIAYAIAWTLLNRRDA